MGKYTLLGSSFSKVQLFYPHLFQESPEKIFPWAEVIFKRIYKRGHKTPRDTTYITHILSNE